MTSAKKTRITNALSSAGLSLTAAMTQQELSAICRIVEAAGGKLTKAADATAKTITAALCDELVIATVASQTHTLTIRALTPGPGAIASITVVDAVGDTLAVTNVAGAITISLANATDSKNTLTLIKAAVELANSSTLGTAHSVGCYITGTASTQVVHGGTNDVTVRAPGGTAEGALKSSVLGTAASVPATDLITTVPAA